MASAAKIQSITAKEPILCHLCVWCQVGGRCALTYGIELVRLVVHQH